MHRGTHPYTTKGTKAMMPIQRHRVRRGSVLFAAAVLAAGVSACSASSGNTSSTSSASSTSSQGGLKSIEFVNPLPDNSSWATVGRCMGAEAKKLGIPFSQTGPTGTSLDANSMISSIQQAIADQVGAIVTFPSDGPLFAPAAEQAKSAHILFATLQGSAEGQESVQVGVDWSEWGTLDAKMISKRGGHQFVGTISTNATPPSSYFVKALTAEGKKLGNVTVVDNQYDNGDATQDAGLVSAMLTAHPNLTVIATPEGSTIPSSTTTIKEAGKQKQVAFFPYGFANGGEQGIKNGSVWTVTTFNLCGEGQQVVQELVALHDGRKVPKQVGIPIKFVTKANIYAVLKQGLFQ